MIDRVYLFVYGTLKRGEPGHELMSGSTYVATAVISHLCWVPGAGYPSCVETSSAADTVSGEIWAVPATDLPLLNEYEGKNYRLVKLRDSNLHAYLLKENDSDRFVETT
jgi:gamma-glutamylcyclotransferase (GGCT)/AIG2-like uncharacterized protein YtfP